MHLLPTWIRRWTAGSILGVALMAILLFNVTHSVAENVNLSAAALSGLATYSSGKIFAPKGVLADAAFIEAGYRNVFVVKSDGTVWAWGDNACGALGDGPDSGFRAYPIQLRGIGGEGYLTNVISISSFFWKNYAVRSDGTVVAWGSNSWGSLATGGNPNEYYPKQVMGIGGVGYLTNIAAVAAGDINSSALKTDGTVVSWRWSTNPYIVNRSLGTPLQNITAISSGDSHGIGLKSDGTVWSWGSNSVVGDTLLYPTGYETGSGYARQMGSITDATAVAATSYHSFALRSNGTVWMWGDTTYETQLEGFTNIVAIKSGTDYLLGLKSDGSVCTYEPHIIKRFLAYPDTPVFTNIIQGDYNSYAISGSSMYGWGYNNDQSFPLLGMPPGSYPQPTLLDTSSRGTAILPAITGYLLSITPDVAVGPDSHISFFFRSGGGQWKKWNGTAWELATFEERASGNSAAEVANIPAAGWSTLPSANVEIGVVFRNSASTPGPFLNSVTYSVASEPTVSLSGSNTAVIGIASDYSASVNTTGGTVAYEWTVTKGTTSSTTNIAPVTFNATGSATVAVKAYIAEYPSLSKTASKSVTVSYAAPAITSVICPSDLQMGEIGQCTITATAPGGTIAYRWYAPDAEFDANDAVSNVYFTKGGSKVVTAQAYLVEDMTAIASSYALVNVSPIDMSLTASCPESAAKTVHFDCVAEGSTDWGTVAYTWTPDAELVSQNYNDSNISLVSASVGQKSVKVKMYLTERPHLYLEKIMTVDVGAQPPEILEASCEETLMVGQIAVCSITATVPEGIIRYQWSSPSEDSVVDAGETGSANIQFKTSGQKTVKVKAYLQEYPTAAVEQTFGITVQPNQITLNLVCPDMAVTDTSIPCTAAASADWGDIQYKWEAQYGKATAGEMPGSGNITFTQEGTRVVKATASIVDAPFVSAEATATVSVISAKEVTPAISGPRYVFANMPATFAVKAPCIDDESCQIKWYVGGAEYMAESVELIFDTPSKVTIVAEAVLANGGGSNTAQHVVYVEALPKPIFNIVGPSAVFEGRETTYTIGLSEKHKILPIEGEWTLPDGSKSSEDSITVSATSNGTFNISYTAWVKDNRSITERTSTRRINAVAYVFPEPKLDVRVTDGYAPFRLTLRTKNTYRPTTGADYGITYNWDFGDGETLTTDKTSVARTFQRVGTYNVTMTAVDAVGNMSSDQVTINATTPPLELALKSSISNAASRTPLTIYVRSAITKRMPLDRVDKYEWRINNTIVEGTQPEYLRTTITEPGTYTFTYAISMLSGATAEKSIEITVNPNTPPVCTIEYTDDAKTKYVTYKAVCTDADGRMSSYKWDLDDGRGYRSGFTRISTKTVESRVYNIKLQATDDAGGVTEITAPITLIR